MRHATLTSKGQTTIPAEIRRKLGLEAGDRLIFEERDGEFIIRKDPGLAALVGCLAHLVPPEDRGRPIQEIIDEEKALAAEAWAEAGLAGEFDEGPAAAADS